MKRTVTFFKNLRRYVKPKIISTKCRTLEDCSICLGPIQISTENTSDRILELKACSHYFHETCLTTWLESKSECPLCRTSIYSWHVHGVYNKLLKFYIFSRKYPRLLMRRFGVNNEISKHKIESVKGMLELTLRHST